jgi:hypothetical protein
MMSILIVLSICTALTLSTAPAIFLFKKQNEVNKETVAWMKSTEEIQETIIEAISSNTEINAGNFDQAGRNFSIIVARLEALESARLDVAEATQGLTQEQSFEIEKAKMVIANLSREEVERCYLELLKYQYRFKNTTTQLLKDKMIRELADNGN